MPGFDRTIVRFECFRAAGYGSDRGSVYPAVVGSAGARSGGGSAGSAVWGGTDSAGDDASARDSASGRGDACRGVAGVGGWGFALVNCHFTRVGDGFGESCRLGGAVAAADLNSAQPRGAPTPPERSRWYYFNVEFLGGRPHASRTPRKRRRKHLVQCERLGD